MIWLKRKYQTDQEYDSEDFTYLRDHKEMEERKASEEALALPSIKKRVKRSEREENE